MIKGVNKKIVEINNTNSLYFEKAILYVRPNMTDIPNKLLSNEAMNYLNCISPPNNKRKLLYLKILLTLLASLILVAAICILMSKFSS